MNDEIKNLSAIDPEDILYKDDKHFNLGNLVDKIRALVQGANDIIQYQEYWSELPAITKNHIINEINNLISIVNTLRSNRDNAEWLTANLNSYKQSLEQYYNTLFPHLITNIRSYKSSSDTQKQEVLALIKQLRIEQEEVKKTKEAAKASSILAGEAASSISTSELSKYFDDLANGNIRELKKKYKKTWFFRSFLADGYVNDANRWLLFLIIAIIITAFFSNTVYYKLLNTTIKLESVLAGVLLLAAPAYAVKFCAKQYNNNKLLQVSNIHRAVVMKTVLAFLSREELTDDIKSTILFEAAKQVFKQPENNEGKDVEPVLEIPAPWRKLYS